MADGYDDFWAVVDGGNPPPAPKGLAQLSEMAPPGLWVAYTESQLAGTIAEIAGQPIAACYDISWLGKKMPRPDTAVFIAALVNAYREGRLVEKDATKDVEGE